MALCPRYYGYYHDLHLAYLYRKYRAGQLANPCEARAWRMRAYRAEMCAIKLHKAWLEICGADWQAA